MVDTNTKTIQRNIVHRFQLCNFIVTVDFFVIHVRRKTSGSLRDSIRQENHKRFFLLILCTSVFQIIDGSLEGPCPVRSIICKVIINLINDGIIIRRKVHFGDPIFMGQTLRIPIRIIREQSICSPVGRDIAPVPIIRDISPEWDIRYPAGSIDALDFLNQVDHELLRTG